MEQRTTGECHSFNSDTDLGVVQGNKTNLLFMIVFECFLMC